MESLIKFLTIVEKLAMIAFGSVGSWVAFQGLKAWRVKLRGEADFDLARRLLHSLAHIESHIEYVRDSVNRDREQLVSASQSLSEAFEGFLTMGHEAVAVWGRPWREVCRDAMRVHRDLSGIALRDSLLDSNIGEMADEFAKNRPEELESERFVETMRAILKYQREAWEVSITTKFQASLHRARHSVGKIEDFLRTKLPRGE